MPCRCKGDARGDSSSAEQQALWAPAFSRAGLSADVLPRALRPMAPDEALQTLRPTGERSARHAWAALGMTFLGAPVESVTASPLGTLANVRSELQLTEQAIVLSQVFGASLGVMTQFLLSLLGAIDRHDVPCGAPHGDSTFNARSRTTQLRSSVVVYRPLDQVAPLLDPRRWDECSELFTRTCQVAEPPGCDFECVEPTAQPTPDRRGFLYERATVGPQEIENLLSVRYEVTSDQTRPEAVKVDYSLYRAVSHRLGGFESPGLFRANSGDLRAGRIDHDNPFEPSNRDCTLIEVTKDVQYARMSAWSGSPFVDYGELANYLAPAFLTLWIANLQLIVPCCPD